MTKYRIVPVRKDDWAVERRWLWRWIRDIDFSFTSEKQAEDYITLQLRQQVESDLHHMVVANRKRAIAPRRFP